MPQSQACLRRKDAEERPVNLTLFEPIRDELGAVEARMLAAVRDADEPLSSALAGLLTSGGKRLRPALVILSARLFQWDPEPVTNLAAAVEMLHTATLIHDDTIDGAAMRRGHRTLNATWHRSATILAGDYLFARAAALAAATSSNRVSSIFANTLLVICQGELQQMLSLFDWRGNREQYYQRIYAKTASLFAASCEGGAVLAQAPEAQVLALRQYGHHLGIAFQIVDDVLDFCGDARHLGKPVGSDLRQGIATLPVYHYLQSGGEESLVAAALDRTVAEGPAHAEAVSALVAAVVSSGAIEGCRREAEGYVQRAVGNLAALGDGPYPRTLRSLAEFVVARDA